MSRFRSTQARTNGHDAHGPVDAQGNHASPLAPHNSACPSESPTGRPTEPASHFRLPLHTSAAPDSHTLAPRQVAISTPTRLNRSVPPAPATAQLTERKSLNPKKFVRNEFETNSPLSCPQSIHSKPISIESAPQSRSLFFASSLPRFASFSTPPHHLLIRTAAHSAKAHAAVTSSLLSTGSDPHSPGLHLPANNFFLFLFLPEFHRQSIDKIDVTGTRTRLERTGNELSQVPDSPHSANFFLFAFLPEIHRQTIDKTAVTVANTPLERTGNELPFLHSPGTSPPSRHPRVCGAGLPACSRISTRLEPESSALHPISTIPTRLNQSLPLAPPLAQTTELKSLNPTSLIRNASETSSLPGRLQLSHPKILRIESAPEIQLIGFALSSPQIPPFSPHPCTLPHSALALLGTLS